jgi:hypothetical protein
VRAPQARGAARTPPPVSVSARTCERVDSRDPAVPCGVRPLRACACVEKNDTLDSDSPGRARSRRDLSPRCALAFLTPSWGYYFAAFTAYVGAMLLPSLLAFHTRSTPLANPWALGLWLGTPHLHHTSLRTLGWRR